MGLKDFFKFKVIGNVPAGCLDEIYSFPFLEKNFIIEDIETIYTKILTDCANRATTLTDEMRNALYDNCLASEQDAGIITLLSKAMLNKQKLFLVYKNGVVRKADTEEQERIELDYEKTNSSNLGVFVSFANYTKTDMLRIYSLMEYCVLQSLYKSMKLATATQMKISNLRQSIAEHDSIAAINQAKNIAAGLKEGKDILLDSADDILTNKPEIDAIKESINFINEKKAFYLNLPISYITGNLTSGIGSTGESDVKAIERGLSDYFYPILKPTLDAIFNKDIQFKSQDFRLMDSALNTLRTFEMIGEDLVTKENKRIIVSKILNIDYNPKDFAEVDKEKEENKALMQERFNNNNEKEDDEKEDDND